jgi:hypothetical protein
LFPFLTIVDAKYSCLKLALIIKRGKFLVWLTNQAKAAKVWQLWLD